MKESALEAIRVLQQVSPTQWELYGEMLLPAIGTGISVFFMAMQKLFKVNRGRFILLWVLISILAVVCGLYVRDVVSANPAMAFTVTSLFVVILHSFILKPAVKRYAPKFTKLIDNAKLFNERKANAKAALVEDIPGRITS